MKITHEGPSLAQQDEYASRNRKTLRAEIARLQAENAALKKSKTPPAVAAQDQAPQPPRKVLPPERKVLLRCSHR